MMANAQIKAEIIALKQADGLIYAEDVVDWAQANDDSALHSCFQWDLAKAARAHWIDTARALIQVHVVDVKDERITISLVRDRQNGGGYRDLQDVLRSANMRKEAVQEAIRELEQWERRYKHFNELKTIFRAILRAKVANPGPSPRPHRGRPGAGTGAPPPPTP